MQLCGDWLWGAHPAAQSCFRASPLESAWAQARQLLSSGADPDSFLPPPLRKPRAATWPLSQQHLRQGRGAGRAGRLPSKLVPTERPPLRIGGPMEDMGGGHFEVLLYMGPLKLFASHGGGTEGSTIEGGTEPQPSPPLPVWGALLLARTAPCYPQAACSWPSLEVNGEAPPSAQWSSSGLPASGCLLSPGTFAPAQLLLGLPVLHVALSVGKVAAHACLWLPRADSSPAGFSSSATTWSCSGGYRGCWPSPPTP